MEIAVLGGGNGSVAAAADLTLNGHSVRLWRRNADGVSALNARGNRLTVNDFSGTREAVIGLVTTDMGVALAGAELIVCPTPATA